MKVNEMLSEEKLQTLLKTINEAFNTAFDRKVAIFMVIDAGDSGMGLGNVNDLEALAMVKDAVRRLEADVVGIAKGRH